MRSVGFSIWATSASTLAHSSQTSLRGPVSLASAVRPVGVREIGFAEVERGDKALDREELEAQPRCAPAFAWWMRASPTRKTPLIPRTPSLRAIPARSPRRPRSPHQRLRVHQRLRRPDGQPLHELRIKRVQLNNALVLALGITFQATLSDPASAMNIPTTQTTLGINLKTAYSGLASGNVRIDNVSVNAPAGFSATKRSPPANSTPSHQTSPLSISMHHTAFRLRGLTSRAQTRSTQPTTLPIPSLPQRTRCSCPIRRHSHVE